MEIVRFRAMNTDIVLAGEGETGRLAEGFKAAEKFVHDSEDRFTRFVETSELSQLNQSAGSWFKASADLYAVVRLAQKFFHLTRGLFDPSILPELRKAGYDRSIELVREEGAGPLLEYMLSREHASFSEMEVDDATSMIHMPTGMELDLGGIAKGWIAEQAGILLSQYANVCGVNAGGDMYLVGVPEGLLRWPVELEDPFQPENTLTRLGVEPGGLATSTVTKRTWKQNGFDRHHLIDPRSGEPAVTEWVSVTVTAPHAYEAEVYAKALLLSGPDESEEIARSSGIPFSYLAVDRYKNIHGTQKSLEEIYVH
jgi:FAD:protein FMN transferase